MLKINLFVGCTFSIVAILSSQYASADEWATLPFYSNTAIFVTGAGLSPLGDKVGPCLEADKQRVTPNGNYRFAISMADDSKNTAHSESKTNAMSFEGGARFGVAGGGAKYESLKKETLETTDDDRSVNIYLEAISEISNEVGYDYSLTNTGKKFLSKNRVSFIENCGVLIATELSRIVSVRASIVIQFRSLEQKKSFINKAAFSADGNYGPYSAKLSVMNQLDSTLTQNNSYFSFNASLEAKGEEGLIGLSEYTKMLQDVKSDPFKRSLEALSAVLKSYKGDKGAINKIRFVPVETLVPEAELSSWPIRANFWQTASSLYEAMTSFESINNIRFNEQDPYLRRFSQELIIKTCVEKNPSSNEAEFNDPFCVPYIYNKDSSTNLSRIKQNIRTLISLCMSSSESNSPFCDKGSLVIISARLLKLYYPNKFHVKSIPKKFDAYSVESMVSGGNQEINPSIERRKELADESFSFWLYGLSDGEPSSWKDNYFKEAIEILNENYSLTPEDLITGFSYDVKNAVQSLFNYDVHAYAFDRESKSELPLQLNYKSGSVSLRISGPAEVEKLIFVLPSGSTLLLEMGYKEVFNDTDVMYWWGDGEQCTPHCKAYSSELIKFLHEAHETKGELYIYAQTVSGMKVKHIASLAL